MAFVPAKIIEKTLKKEGIDVDGYSVVQWIDNDAMAEATKLGMDKGITEEFGFASYYPIENGTVTFDVCICQDTREMASGEQIIYYYTEIYSCRIEREGEVKVISLDAYWK